MSRLLKILCASLLILLLLVIVGCGGATTGGSTPSPVAGESVAQSTGPSTTQNEQWKSMLQQAFTLEDENAAIQTKMGVRLQKFFAKLQNASGIGAIKKSLDLLGEANGLVGKMKDNSATLAGLWDEMAALNIDEAHTTYAGQQKKIAELGLQNDVLMRQWFAEEADAIDQLTKATSSSQANEAVKKLQGAVARYSVKVAKLGARINELKQTSDQYYKLNVAQ